MTITTTKLNIQFDAVLSALAGALIRRPTISAGWSIWERERSKSVSLVQFKLRRKGNKGGRAQESYGKDYCNTYIKPSHP